MIAIKAQNFHATIQYRKFFEYVQLTDRLAVYKMGCHAEHVGDQGMHQSEIFNVSLYQTESEGICLLVQAEEFLANKRIDLDDRIFLDATPLDGKWMMWDTVMVRMYQEQGWGVFSDNEFFRRFRLSDEPYTGYMSDITRVPVFMSTAYECVFDAQGQAIPCRIGFNSTHEINTENYDLDATQKVLSENPQVKLWHSVETDAYGTQARRYSLHFAFYPTQEQMDMIVDKCIKVNGLRKPAEAVLYFNMLCIESTKLPLHKRQNCSSDDHF